MNPRQIRTKRWQSFVLVDAVVTLPVLVCLVREFLIYPSAGSTRWGYLVILASVLAVMSPSLLCLAGRKLPQMAALVLILFYLLFIGFLYLRMMHDGSFGQVLGHIACIVLIAKSIYGACMVCKSDAEF